MQKGNCCIVNVKSIDSYRIRTLMGSRSQLVGMHTAVKNQIRGVLKTFGAVVSNSEEEGFDAKLRATTKGNRMLQELVKPLLKVLEAVHAQVSALDKMIENYAENDTICRHLMTIPGVGSVTAVAFTTAIDDPKRFRKSRSVGAYFGLTNRRQQSGEMDRAGRISKWGDPLVRRLSPPGGPFDPDANQVVVCTQGLGDADCQALGGEQSNRGCGPQARGDYAPNVAYGRSVPLVGNRSGRCLRAKEEHNEIRRLTDMSLAGTIAPVSPHVAVQLHSKTACAT